MPCFTNSFQFISTPFIAGETRRIPLRKLWNSETKNVSFQCLVDLALKYAGFEHESVSEVYITYSDGDGDIIAISSSDELSEAFEQFVDKHPPVVRATAKVHPTNIKNEQHPGKPACGFDVLSW